MELAKPEPKTVQRTVRVPIEIDRRLESAASKPGISVPRAIVQILKAWEDAEEKKARRGKKK